MPKGFGNQGTSCLSVTILALIILQIAIGLALIIVVELLKSYLLKYMASSQRDEICVTLFFMDIFGTQLAIYYFCGIPLVRKCSRDPCALYMGTLLSMWHFFIFVAIICGFLMSYMILESSKSIEKSTEISLLRGIEIYYNDPDWRLTWDDLQYHEECCGVKSFKDWQTTAWIEETYEKKDDSPCESELISLTPYSCCKKNTNCFENYVPQKTSETWVELPTMNVSAINTRGCLPIFSDHMHSLLIAICCIDGIILLIAILILILMRIFFVKAQNYCLVETTDSECQATIVVKCPRNFQCDVTHDSEFEDTEAEEKSEPEDHVHRKGCPCKERRKVSFGCNDDEYSPLLLH